MIQREEGACRSLRGEAARALRGQRPRRMKRGGGDSGPEGEAALGLAASARELQACFYFCQPHVIIKQLSTQEPTPGSLHPPLPLSVPPPPPPPPTPDPNP